MSSASVQVYLRRTSGMACTLQIKQKSTIFELYEYAKQTLNLQNIVIFWQGKQLEPTLATKVSEINLQNGGILHVQHSQQTNNQNQSEKQSGLILQIRVFCNNLMFGFRTSAQANFMHLREQLARVFNCRAEEVVMSYLGRVLNVEQSYLKCGVQNGDLISSMYCNQQNQNQVKNKNIDFPLKPKITESVTFSPSQPHVQAEPFSKQLMRKSSMKSSQDSRQAFTLQSKKFLQALRPKSECQLNNDQLQQSHQSFDLQKHPWLSNKKMIETQSIHFDDPEEQEGPQWWIECSLEISNKENSKFYNILCDEESTLKEVLNLLCRHERKQIRSLSFANEGEQKMAQNGDTILSIAKVNKTKIIHCAIFNQIDKI